MWKSAQFLYVSLLVLVPLTAIAGPTEDANATVDRWSAAYSTNDPEVVVQNYWSDAIVLGTVSPVMSEGTEAIRTYFSPLKGKWQQEHDRRKAHTCA
jgi:hypothetical protein